MLHRSVRRVQDYVSAEPRRPAGYVATLVVVALAVLVLRPLRDSVGLLNIGLLFLLAVTLIAARWGWGPGAFASVSANLALNFFFIEPLHRLTVQEPANALALIVFVVVAGLTSALLGRARRGEADARQREQETALLYELSRLIIGDVDLVVTLTRVCERVRDTFAAQSCAVLLPEGGRLMAVAWVGVQDSGYADVDEQQAAEQARVSGQWVALGGRPGRLGPRMVGRSGRRAPIVYLPLRSGGHGHGVLRVVGRLQSRVFTEDELRLLNAFADEAAPAVERDRLLREAARVQALQEADQLKSALLSAVSHDLRTPLTTILASASSLLQPDVTWDEATRRQFLVQIEDQALRLTRVVGNLLDLSRIEGGALQPDSRWYDVAELLESVVTGLGSEEARARITVDVAPDVGEAPFDHVHVSQAVTNLVENALKFSPAGTTVDLSARRDDNTIAISVADHGPGIPPEERARVFERFYRGSGAGRARGSGLGLAIAKGFVEANGGDIRVEENPSRGGSRFVIRLPAPPPPVSALAISGEKAP